VELILQRGSLKLFFNMVDYVKFGECWKRITSGKY